MGVEPRCRPRLASHFAVEHEIVSNGVHADIRHVRWQKRGRSLFHADSYYIDYSLSPRFSGSRLTPSNQGRSAPPGEIVFLPAGSAFEAEYAPGETRLLCVTFDEGESTRLFEREPTALDACFDVRNPRVRQVMARLAEEVREPGFAHDILLESMAVTLVVELCRYLRTREDESAWRGRIADWRLRQLKEQIDAGLSGPLSVADLAAACGMSARHLIRTFKNTTGVTLSDYIAAARIERAKEELSREDALIKVVAGNCGFASPAAFSASFRKATGRTPKAFREERFRYLI